MGACVRVRASTHADTDRHTHITTGTQLSTCLQRLRPSTASEPCTVGKEVHVLKISYYLYRVLKVVITVTEYKHDRRAKIDLVQPDSGSNYYMDRKQLTFNSQPV